MHEGRRPGGLTALAVLNFVGAGLDVFILLWLLAVFAFADRLADEAERQAKERAARAAPDEHDHVQISPEDREAVSAMRRLGRNRAVPVNAGLVFACGCLLVAGGVGYLGQRRWGRVVGNLYTLASVAGSVCWILLMPEELGGRFRFLTLLFFVFPVATLLLVNTTFREDLAR